MADKTYLYMDLYSGILEIQINFKPGEGFTQKFYLHLQPKANLMKIKNAKKKE